MNASPSQNFEPERLRWRPQQLPLPPSKPKREGAPLSLRAVSFARNKDALVGFLLKCKRRGNGRKGDQDSGPWRKYAFLTPCAVDVLTHLIADERVDLQTMQVRTRMRFLKNALGYKERTLAMALYELEAGGLLRRLPIDRQAARLGGVHAQLGQVVSRGELQILALRGVARVEREEAVALAKGFTAEGRRVARRRRGRPASDAGGGEIQRGGTETKEIGRISPLLSDPSALSPELKDRLDLVTPSSARAGAPGEGMCLDVAALRLGDVDRPEPPSPVERQETKATENPTDSIPVGVATVQARSARDPEHAVPAPPARLPAAPPGTGRESRGGESTRDAARHSPADASPRSERTNGSATTPARPGGVQGGMRPLSAAELRVTYPDIFAGLAVVGDAGGLDRGTAPVTGGRPAPAIGGDSRKGGRSESPAGLRPPDTPVAELPPAEALTADELRELRAAQTRAELARRGRS